ncbi:MAG: hypothetical protein JXA24_02510 [Proteobacteria bacterium]|nr:hypothetical protein [Pseudomonadota bacterium]
MRFAAAAIASLALMLTTTGAADAYLLPPYRMSDAQSNAPAEETFREYDDIMASVRQHLPLGVADSRRKDYKKRLTPRQSAAADRFHETKEAYEFWGYVIDLKGKLLAMHPRREDPDVRAEADGFAKAAVQRIYDISQEYQIPVSALFRNWEVNKGRRKKGHCYHYVNDIRRELRKRPWRHFEMRWGEAWPGGIRENNALIIVAAGQPFETGLAIDIWRSAGRPFWTPVKGDFYPWQDAGDLEIEEN